MGVATVAFRKCVLNLQSDGSQDGRLASRVIFALDIDGENYKDVYVKVREVPESEIHERLLEISELHGYEGPFNYPVLEGSIEFYFRQVTEGIESLINTQENFSHCVIGPLSRKWWYNLICRKTKETRKLRGECFKFKV